jgi:hypothetical protein
MSTHHETNDVEGGAQINKAKAQGWKVEVHNTGLSFPKIPSGLDSHRKAESLHHCERCLRSSPRLACMSPTCSSRGGGLRPRICFSAIS